MQQGVRTLIYSAAWSGLSQYRRYSERVPAKV
jgi:hypothetical protein